MKVEVLEKIIKITALCESESVKGALFKVTLDERGWTCTCLHHQKRGARCKHIIHVEAETE